MRLKNGPRQPLTPPRTHKTCSLAQPPATMMEVTTAQRQHVRYAHEVAITLHFGKRSTTGRTRNVSRGGLCANVAQAVATGTDIEVDIVLVFEDDTQSEPLRLPARVAWCTTVDDEFQVGVSFKPLDAKRVNYLQLFLKYLGQDKAQKSPRIDNVDDRFR